MLFDTFLEQLPGTPSFTASRIQDINPLGGTDQVRIIRAPNKSMEILHNKLKNYLRSLNVNLFFSTACKRKASPRKNALRHKNNRYFYLIDIHQAYPSVDGEKLSSILCSLDKKLENLEKDVFLFLKKYCLTPQGGLITGAPASPDFFNIYAAILVDEPMGKLCKRYGLTFTRYLDDLTFSSPKVPIGKRKRKAIREVVERAEFTVSHHKSKVYDLKKAPIVINGVGLEWGGRIFLPRHYLRKIKGLIHKAEKERDKELPKTIHGMMGVFRAISRHCALNEVEQKLVKKYQALKANLV